MAPVFPAIASNVTTYSIPADETYPALRPDTLQQCIPETEYLQASTISEAKAALLKAAWQEWKRWGEERAVVERNDGRHCLLDEAGNCYPEEETFRNFKVAMPYSEAQCRILIAYWRAVNREFNCDDVNSPQWPWSAAFISWLFQKAGYSRDAFIPSEGHARYIVDARDQRLAHGILKAEQTPALPEVGDLVCSVRARDKQMADMHEIEAGKTLSHCDLVMTVNLEKKEVNVIGGNVFGVVALTTVELDDSLRVNRETNSRRPWLVVLRQKDRQYV